MFVLPVPSSVAMRCLLNRFHKMTRSLSSPVTMVLLSGRKATQVLTDVSSPPRACGGFLVSVFHSWTTPSDSLVASTFPSGLKASPLMTASWWSLRRAIFFPVAGSHRVVRLCPYPPAAASMPSGLKASGPPPEGRDRSCFPVRTSHSTVVPELPGASPVSVVSPVARVLPSGLKATEET